MTVAMPSSGGAKDQMFWVCCNTCAVPIFTEKDGQPVKMFLASCGCEYLSFIVNLIRKFPILSIPGIYCSSCTERSTKPRCSTCGTPEVGILPVGKNLPSTALEMFNNSETSLAKFNNRRKFQVWDMCPMLVECQM